MSVDLALFQALGVFSSLMFLLWAIVLPEFRVYLTSGLAFGGFGLMALLSGDVVELTDTGTEAAVGVPGALTMFLGALAILSGVAMLFDVWGIDMMAAELDEDARGAKE